jgi:hypothetical protein
MARYHVWLRAFAAVTCWLTFLAGADDFNLARAVFPLPAPAPDTPLPEDDPNTDFTAGSESASPTTTHPGKSVPPVPAPLMLAGPGLATPVAPPARPSPLRAGIDAPLRC